MHSSSHGFLFIAGTARSGTTTVADYLRLDRRIVIGRERYAYVLERGDLTPAHFAKNRFLVDFRLDDSHHQKLQPYYSDAADYFEDAIWVGDKLPRLFMHYAYFFARFPNASVIYCLRDPVHVALSFERRAEETRALARAGRTIERRWPPNRGWREGVVEWNRSIKETLRLQSEHRFFVMDYARLYRDEAALNALYRFLGLRLQPHLIAAWEEKAAERRGIEADRRHPGDGRQIAEIKALADWQSYEALVSISTKQNLAQ